jgi:REP element-mobilizing transposase RayT
MQLRLPLPRPPKKPKLGRPKGKNGPVAHRARPLLASRFPVHVTLRVREAVWNLRSKRSFRVLRRAFFAGRDRFGFRLNHYSVQGNHLHLIVEATDAQAMSRGMQGLAIRMAKRLNAMMGRHGAVFAERYHSRILRTPAETRNALHYVLFNRHKHLAELGTPIMPAVVDEYSSANPDEEATVIEPRTWLLERAAAVERASGAGAGS